MCFYKLFLDILFVIFSHFSHADIPESCVRLVGGQLDDVIKVSKEVLHKSECATHVEIGKRVASERLISLCHPDGHYRRGGESEGGSVL